MYTCMYNYIYNLLHLMTPQIIYNNLELAIQESSKPEISGNDIICNPL